MENEKLIKSWIDVTFGMKGYFAVLRGEFQTEDGKTYADNISSGSACKDHASAVIDAKIWAEVEGIPCHAG